MAAKTIDILTFDLMRGCIAPAAQSLGGFDRLGEDGRTYRLDGKRPTPSALSTTSVQTTAALAQTRLEACQALEGSLVGVTDARNTSFLYVRIIQVRSVIRPCLVGGQARWRVDSQWTLERTDVD